MPRPISRPQPPEASTQEAAPASKTRRKQDMHALQALGERLAELRPEQLRSLALPEALEVAIADYRRFTKWEARRRQMQYIGRLMRDVDPTPITAQFEAWQRTSRTAVTRFHEAETWRDRLLSEAGALDRFCAEHPAADPAALAKLRDTARAEQSAGRPPAAARRLFREVSRLLLAEHPETAGER
jgi:ribosome-associated protein